MPFESDACAQNMISFTFAGFFQLKEEASLLRPLSRHPQVTPSLKPEL